MANILDYLDWFGDITFEQVPFCEADALVLAQLAYVRLEGIVPSVDTDDAITVAEAAQMFRQLNRKDRIYLSVLSSSLRWRRESVGKTNASPISITA